MVNISAVKSDEFFVRWRKLLPTNFLPIMYSREFKFDNKGKKSQFTEKQQPVCFYNSRNTYLSAGKFLDSALHWFFFSKSYCYRQQSIWENRLCNMFKLHNVSSHFSRKWDNLEFFTDEVIFTPTHMTHPVS